MECMIITSGFPTVYHRTSLAAQSVVHCSWCSAAYAAPAFQHYMTQLLQLGSCMQQFLLQVNLIETYGVQRLASILLLKLCHDAVYVLLPVALLQLHRATYRECNTPLLHHATPQSRLPCFPLHFEPDNLEQDERGLYHLAQLQCLRSNFGCFLMAVLDILQAGT